MGHLVYLSLACSWVIFLIGGTIFYRRMQRFKNRLYVLKERDNRHDQDLKELRLLMKCEIDQTSNAHNIILHPGSIIPPDKVKTILVVKLDHIGDLVLATPALMALRQRFPSAHITALVSHWSKDVLKYNPDVDELAFFDFFPENHEARIEPLTREEKKLLRDLLVPRQFDIAIDLRKEPETREILALSQAKYTVGYGGHSLETGLTVELPSFRSQKHRAEQLLDLVRALGAATTDCHPRVYISEEEKDFARNFLEERAVRCNDILIGVHPGGRESMRRWFPDRYSELLDKIHEKFPEAQVVLFGGPLEHEIIQKILSTIHFRPIECFQRITLLQFAAILEKMHVLIGNNSGPIHLASAMGTPAVAINSGIIDFREWGPYGKKNVVLSADLPCAPCYREPCHRWYYLHGEAVPLYCLNVIQVEDVLKSVEVILRESLSVTQA